MSGITKTVLFDTFLGGALLGLVSYLSNIYGENNPAFFKVLAFIWAVPLTFFFFINMASRYGKQPIEDFSRHALIGTALTFVLALMTIYIIDQSMDTIIYFCFGFATISTVLYFALGVYKY